MTGVQRKEQQTMATKHTQGTWMTDPDYDAWVQCGPVELDRSIRISPKIELDDEDRANVRLVAAAPSLLEACKAVAHAAEDFIALLKRRKQTTKAKWKSAGGEMGHALWLAEAAIADAEGKTE